MRAEEAVHVGDSLEADVEGALAVGMRAVWVGGEAGSVSGGAAIRSICELPELLAGLRL